MENKIIFRKGWRVYLRPIEESDLHAITVMINDENMTQYLGSDTPRSTEDERAWLENLSKNRDKDQVLAVVLIENEALIGLMGVHGINLKDGIAKTGAFIGKKECRGKGYGTEAKMLLMNYAFNTLNIRKLCSEHLAFNDASRKYQEKCGYKQEGYLRAHRFKNGAYHDCVVTAVFREDWLPFWVQYKAVMNERYPAT